MIDEADDASVADSNVPDLYDYVYSNIPESTHILKPMPNCHHCGAKRFKDEPKGFCCRDGKISLSNLDMPPQLIGFGQA